MEVLDFCEYGQMSAINELYSRLMDADNKGIRSTAQQILQSTFAPLSAKALIRDEMRGLPAYMWNRHYFHQVQSNWTSVCNELKEALAKVYDWRRYVVSIVGDRKALEAAVPIVKSRILDPIIDRTPADLDTSHLSYTEKGFIAGEESRIATLLKPRLKSMSKTESILIDVGGQSYQNSLQARCRDPNTPINHKEAIAATFLQTRE